MIKLTAGHPSEQIPDFQLCEFRAEDVQLGVGD